MAGGARPELLDSYQAERRPVAAGVLALSDALLARALADKGITTRRDAGTTQLDVGYRDSALVRDDRSGRGGTGLLRAGDRAPDATGLVTADGRRRLFDLTRGGRFTLLRFGTAPAVEPAPPGLRVLHVSAGPVGPVRPAGPGAPTGPRGGPGGVPVADTEGHLARAYGATDRTLVLIRPDGHVALISDAGDACAAADRLTAFA